MGSEWSQWVPWNLSPSEFAACPPLVAFLNVFVAALLPGQLACRRRCTHRSPGLPDAKLIGKDACWYLLGQNDGQGTGDDDNGYRGSASSVAIYLDGNRIRGFDSETLESLIAN